jgi:hypothetical protein
VTVIEPNETLRYQTAEKLAFVDFGIQVVTIDYFYQYGTNDTIIILNEYDTIIDKNPYAVYNQQLAGVWNFRDKHVIAFSATSSASYERFVANCIVKPKMLKFKSEYELVHGTSPIQDPNIISCNG